MVHENNFRESVTMLVVEENEGSEGASDKDSDSDPNQK